MSYDVDVTGQIFMYVKINGHIVYVLVNTPPPKQFNAVTSNFAGAYT